jgi:hypothetical protein
MTYYCRHCKADAYLPDDEDLVFREHNLFIEGDLKRCPYCITKPISMEVEGEHMRMTGRGWLYGASGYHSVSETKLIVVEPRDRDEIDE